MDHKLCELCICCLETDAVTTVQSPTPSTMSQLFLCYKGESFVTEKRDTAIRWVLPNHCNVCPQALLSLGPSVCLFVSLKCFLEWIEVPNFPYKNPGTINRNMKDRPGNAGRCFERIKRLETDGFAQWHGSLMSQAITLLPQLLYVKHKNHITSVRTILSHILSLIHCQLTLLTTIQINHSI